jgi:glycerol kinase
MGISGRWQDGAGRRTFASEGTLNSIAAALAPYAVDACRVEDMVQDDIFCSPS